MRSSSLSTHTLVLSRAPTGIATSQPRPIIMDLQRNPLLNHCAHGQRNLPSTPQLPPELQREIIELAVRSGHKDVQLKLKLSLVAHHVHFWSANFSQNQT